MPPRPLPISHPTLDSATLWSQFNNLAKNGIPNQPIQRTTPSAQSPGLSAFFGGIQQLSQSLPQAIEKTTSLPGDLAQEQLQKRGYSKLAPFVGLGINAVVPGPKAKSGKAAVRAIQDTQRQAVLNLLQKAKDSIHAIGMKRGSIFDSVDVDDVIENLSSKKPSVESVRQGMELLKRYGFDINQPDRVRIPIMRTP